MSKLEDRRLKKIVKSDTSSELSLSQADKSALIGDDTNVLQICANDDRRKIRKGNKGNKVSTAEMNLNKNIIGNSHENHNIKSAL